jgi:hypothetical protein
MLFGQSENMKMHDEIAAVKHALPVAKKRHQKRGRYFNVEEDTILVSDWLNVTLDHVNGVDQSRSTYWKRIHDYFHANKKFDFDCSQGSCTVGLVFNMM